MPQGTVVTGPKVIKMLLEDLFKNDFVYSITEMLENGKPIEKTKLIEKTFEQSLVSSAIEYAKIHPFEFRLYAGRMKMTKNDTGDSDLDKDKFVAYISDFRPKNYREYKVKLIGKYTAPYGGYYVVVGIDKKDSE